ncbi:alpha/beta hydrolase fold domain-containing protein [Amycolatopsis sp. NPDC051061]|uniref:alpha/beta hydrolase fold domain-containing protein n=1 Tax=Amycolatopsis sp. NPDC051061 TaxID=3155042 RepID=UPI003437B459
MIYREVPGFRPVELDLTSPDDAVATIVYLHGGGWRRGSRLTPLPGFEKLTDELAAQGFRVAAADYRLSGEAVFPAPLDDVRAAIEFVRDERPLFVWGESAGAHLGLLAALTRSEVDGVVAWFPPTDLLGLRGDVSREALLLGANPEAVPELAQEASPLTHAHAGAPPVLLMHGEDDDLVPAAQSVRLAEALRAAGAPVELHLVPGARHRWTGADPAAVVATSVKFLRAALSR